MTVAINKLSLTDATEELADRIVGAQSHRIEVPVDRVDPLKWLAAQRGTDTVYWRDRTGEQEMAGIGRADLVETTDNPEAGRNNIADVLNRVSDGLQVDQKNSAQYFGGLRFDPAYPESSRDPSWERFGAARFVLPRFELIRRDDQTTLVCNLTDTDLKTDCEKIAAEAGQLNPPSQLGDSWDQPISREYSPDRTEWTKLVDYALEQIASDRLSKLVLARRCSLAFDQAPTPWQILDGLRTNTSNCFLFAFGMDGTPTFVGASPERLYRRDGRRVKTEAIAGTRPRGESPGTDRALASELASSQKERWEQRLVVSGLEDGLKRICSDYHISDTTAPLKLARLQHLKTRLEGTLKDKIVDAAILAALHPSPAVGGYPTDKAAVQVRELEPFDRGWYAGPVGWIGRDQAEFAVGIRSALLFSDRLDLYSGAGIVSGSDPESEWAEVESKIGPFLRLLGEAKK